VDIPAELVIKTTQDILIRLNRANPSGLADRRKEFDAAMKKQKLKGFTLVELIIVMALFTLVMYSVTQLIDPVSKYFVRSSNYENTTACLDNMKRSIEGNLKYADRVRVYEHFNPYADSYSSHDHATIKDMNYAPSSTLSMQVEAFYDEFFEERLFLDSSGTIYVLVFDNTQLISDTDLSNNYSNISDYTNDQLNSGKMVMYQFPFDSESGAGLGSPTITDWYVNQKLYGAFDYRFDLGSFAASESSDSDSSDESSAGGGAPSNSFDPADCTITITASEIRREELKLTRQATNQTNTASFSMKNVLDASVKYTTALFDYKTILNPDYDPATDPMTEKYIQDTANPVPRYVSLQTGTDSFDGFYFIFTMPETTNNAVDSAYVSDVESEYGG